MVFANATNATAKDTGQAVTVAPRIAPRSKTSVSAMGLFVVAMAHATAINVIVTLGSRERTAKHVRLALVSAQSTAIVSSVKFSIKDQTLSARIAR